MFAFQRRIGHSAAPAAELGRSGGHAARVRPNAALTAFAAWFGNALRAAEPGCLGSRGGRQACGSPSPVQVSAALARLSEAKGHVGSPARAIRGVLITSKSWEYAQTLL